MIDFKILYCILNPLGQRMSFGLLTGFYVYVRVNVLISVTRKFKSQSFSTVAFKGSYQERKVCLGHNSRDGRTSKTNTKYHYIDDLF